MHHAGTGWASSATRPPQLAHLLPFGHCPQDFLPRKAGMSTSFVPISDLAAVEAAITPRCAWRGRVWPLIAATRHSTARTSTVAGAGPECARPQVAAPAAAARKVPHAPACPIHACPPFFPSRSTKVIYTETLSNPTLVVADIPALAALARRKVRCGHAEGYTRGASSTRERAPAAAAGSTNCRNRPYCCLSLALPQHTHRHPLLPHALATNLMRRA